MKFSVNFAALQLLVRSGDFFREGSEKNNGGGVSLKMRVPKAEVEKLIKSNKDEAEPSKRIMSLQKGMRGKTRQIWLINSLISKFYLALGFKLPYCRKSRVSQNRGLGKTLIRRRAAPAPAPATMGRMHSSGKGISSSALPYKRTPPSWLKISSQDVEENICKFAKKGLTPSQIGVILRDSHGIAQVKSVTGSKILRILKAHGLAPEIPEDLYHLIKKAVSIRKHLERNRKDKDSKFRLILVESRIHRLARYYKKTKKLPPVWK
ncbi:S15/NS1, RNA-binding [Sesbania bispinosa]|nr:S15/NS1, RNA-binding [Sesbania bispinosa]